MGENNNRLLAIVIVTIIHLLLFLLLLQTRQQPRTTGNNDSPRIRLSWIRRELPSPAPSAPTPPVSRPRQTVHPGPLASVSEPAPAQPVAPTPIVIADDAWRPAASDFHFKTEDEAKMQRLLHKPADPSLAAKTILPTLPMQDNTLLGALGRMAHSSDCKELHMALSAHPESAETLLAAMAERGCSN